MMDFKAIVKVCGINGLGLAAAIVSATTLAGDSATSRVVKNVNHSSITKSVASLSHYTTATNHSYKWGKVNRDHFPQESHPWSGTAPHNSGYKWADSGQETNAKATGVASSTTWNISDQAGYRWGIRNHAEQTGYRWGIRSHAEQTGYRWGIRSHAEQTGYRWGIRSHAEQTGYRWGIRSHAEQTGYRWGIRNNAEQTGYRWGIRNNAEQTGYRWGIRNHAEQTGYRWGIRSHAEQTGYRWGIR
ncbi:hypothetical protein H2508_14045 [Parahaliea sp. F7430]|uniref:YXWGXW repeat-containing protein n=1 Tax=Sediminihaliea albiluteola TaxID=2758564 RepID=A0A7W2YKL7_9GAMM|nr:hypothetical protein [Sediminihaliea albiluteola]MBA6414232.1 hypothetical protein [Sediminihaliea albiluteola]